MNENLKTVVYVGVAAVFGLAAWLTLPRTSENRGPERVGQPLFPKFDDTSKAASLQVTWYDDTLGTVETFKVAKDKGQWVVPSQDNYPADAETQLQDSAKSLFQLTCLGVATEIAEEHEQFGVVEPPQGSTGVQKNEYGRLVVLQDGKGDDLVRILVGKEVEGTPGQRFVRIAESGGNLTEPVYVTKIDLEQLPTEFGKWIERDLLQINPNDVAQLTLKDYSIVRKQDQFGRLVNQVQLKMDSTISWDTLEGSWELEQFQVYDDRNNPHDATLADGEELAKAKLDGLKTALDDLKIEGVDRKPEGLGAELKIDEKLRSNEELMTSLVEHGFFAGPPEKPEIFSRNGEVNVDCKDGVRYVLRFGDVAGVQEGSDLGKLNRYLLVSAQVAENMLPRPVLEEVPAGPEPGQPPAEATSEPEPAASGGACQEEEAEAAQAEAKTQPAKTDGQQKNDGKAKADGKTKDGQAPASDAKIDPQQLRRERIKRENERQLKDYDERRKKAEGRVAALNSRFANWYYVISEDTYKKIHLGRGDIIQEGASATESGFGVDAFRKLESDGLKKTTAPAPMPGDNPSGFPGGGFPGSP